MSATLTIENSPNYSRQTDLPWLINNVAESIQLRLVKFERLTHSQAIKVLQEIKWEADVKSFISKPIVHLPLITTLSIGSFALMTRTNYFALSILGLASCKIAIALLATCLLNVFTIMNASTVYNEISKEASRYIDILERSSVVMQVIVK